jgi:hypothetical protein
MVDELFASGGAPPVTVAFVDPLDLLRLATALSEPA